MDSKNASITDDQLAMLTDEIVLLRQEVEVLRNVLDEVRDSLQWTIRNGVLPNHDVIKPLHITSLPLDPAADDFHERVNAVTLADLPDANSSQSGAEDRPTTQQSFLSADR